MVCSVHVLRPTFSPPSSPQCVLIAHAHPVFLPRRPKYSSDTPNPLTWETKFYCVFLESCLHAAGFSSRFPSEMLRRSCVLYRTCSGARQELDRFTVTNVTTPLFSRALFCGKIFAQTGRFADVMDHYMTHTRHFVSRSSLSVRKHLQTAFIQRGLPVWVFVARFLERMLRKVGSLLL